MTKLNKKDYIWNINKTVQYLMPFSIILPVYNEAINIKHVYSELATVLKEKFEIVFVNDGSSDNTQEVLNQIKQWDSRVKIVQLFKNKGQSLATLAGVKNAANNIVVIMDSDGQYDPRDIPRLLNELKGDIRLVSGKRDNRKDSFLYRTASYYGNKWISAFLDLPKFDLGCGLKVAYKEDLIRLPDFKNTHRYYQIIYNNSGLQVKSLKINHRERYAGKSKYSLLKVFVIIPKIFWLKIKKPVLMK